MKYAAVLILSAVMFVGGCAGLGMGGDSKAAPAAAGTNQGQKFADDKAAGPSAVESALAWSEKYTKLSEQMTQEQARSGLLKEENEKLKEKLDTTSKQLEQAQKELTEANSLLVDMRKELNTWKNDVLGFRDEMRKANKAQIEALNRVLAMLGGEMLGQGAEPNSPEKAQVPAEPNAK